MIDPNPLRRSYDNLLDLAVRNVIARNLDRAYEILDRGHVTPSFRMMVRAELLQFRWAFERDPTICTPDGINYFRRSNGTRMCFGTPYDMPGHPFASVARQ